jgi:hypothetical protein
MYFAYIQSVEAKKHHFLDEKYEEEIKEPIESR